MKKVIITCDSTCDLTQEQKQEFGIITQPLYVRMNDTEYKDGVDINTETLFQLVKTSGQLPKTAAVSMQDFLDLWKPYLEEGCEVVHVSLSGDLSACYLNAHLASEEVKGVYVVDGRNLSTGTALLAIEGAIMAKEGKSAKEIYDVLMVKRDKVNASFVLDTVDYLAKGGRCSAVTAFAAGLLKLRLCIEVKDGKMDVCKKYRGKMSNVLQEYVRERLSEKSDVELDRIFITDSGISPEIRLLVEKTILEMKPFARVMFSTAGSTIAAHCGPGTLGILFINK